MDYISPAAAAIAHTKFPQIGWITSHDLADWLEDRHRQRRFLSMFEQWMNGT